MSVSPVAPATSFVLQFGDVELSATDVGTGPAIVMLHAGGEDRQVFLPIAAALAKSGFRCLTIDQRGHGASSAHGADSFDSFATDAVRVLEWLSAPTLLVGSSLGGFAALAAASLRPDLVCGLVLVDVVPDPQPDAARARLQRVAESADGAVRRHWSLVEDILERASQMRSMASELTAKVLLVRGGRSWALTADKAEAFRELVPSVELLCIEEAGHLVARDCPDKLTAGLHAFAMRDDVHRRHAASAAPLERAVSLLHELSAARIPHLGGDLLTHLRGTEIVLRRLGAPEWLRLAGVCHALYGTDGFAATLLDRAERQRAIGILGAAAERAIYQYAACDRDRVYPQLSGTDVRLFDRFTCEETVWEREDVAAFAWLTVANELDLVQRGVLDAATVESVRSLFEDLRAHLPIAVEAALTEMRADVDP